MLANKFTGVRIIYALTAMLILLITLVSCLGKSNETFPMMKLPEQYVDAKIVDMILPQTVIQGEGPIISLRLQMTEEMEAIFLERGYASIRPIPPIDNVPPPGQTLLLTVSVNFSQSVDRPLKELDAIFPGTLMADHRYNDPFAKNLSPGRYNVYAPAATTMPEFSIRYFGSFEVLPND